MVLCLMYHPLYADGTYETNRGAYEYVEWDELDEDVSEQKQTDVIKLLREDEIEYNTQLLHDDIILGYSYEVL